MSGLNMAVKYYLPTRLPLELITDQRFDFVSIYDDVVLMLTEFYFHTASSHRQKQYSPGSCHVSESSGTSQAYPVIKTSYCIIKPAAAAAALVQR